MATLTPISRKPLSLVLPIVGLVGLLVGLLVGTSNGAGGPGALIGLICFLALSLAALTLPIPEKKQSAWQP